VAQQERQLANNFSVININSVNSNQNNVPGVCIFCGKNGHTENVCFRKVGFPGQDNRTYKNNRKTCTHCGRNGHTVDTCYKKHGYPPRYKFYNGKTGQINNVVTTDEVVSEHSQKKQENRDFHLIGQQYQVTSELFRQHSCSNSANLAHVNQVGSFTANLKHKAMDQSPTGNIYASNSIKKNWKLLDFRFRGNRSCLHLFICF